MTTSDTPSQGIGLPEAASQFEAILSGDTGKQTREREPAEESPASEDDAETLDASALDDETPAPAGDEDEEAPANDEDAEEASDESEQFVTVKIDGKEEQIPLKEAIAGYQRQADYSRKTMAHAERVKAFEQEASQVMAERAQYAQLLGALQEQLAQSVQAQPDWEKLYAEDPLEYVRQKDLFRENQERLQAAQAEQQRVGALMQQQQMQQLQNLVTQGRQQLTELIPAWKDSSRFEADRVRLRQYAEKLGYSSEEVSQVYDPRAVVALYKAMRHDEIMGKRPSPQPQNGPRPLRPGAPQAMPTRKSSEVTKAKNRLAQTGNVKDAAKYFESIL